MATTTTNLELKVTADARAAVSGLAPLETALDDVKASSASAEQSLNELGGQHTISVNDTAIKEVQAEITRLRTQMRESLRLDVNANTGPTQTRINALRRTLRELKLDENVNIKVTSTGTAQAESKLAALDNTISGMIPGLGSMAGGLKGIGVASAAAFAGWKVTNLAADVETLSIQLDSVFGNGQQVLDMLRDWSNEAPFGLDSTAQAARTLGLAGIDLKDLPGVLDDIGTAASLAPGDMNQNLQSISLVVAQMLNKGKIMAEEVQQLAEQGVPAWKVLAASQGKSVAQVQKLTTQGKLGRDAILGFVDEFNKMFPKAMSDQADSFNGKMSTLKDTLNNLGANIGSQMLPMLKKEAEALIVVGQAAAWAADQLHPTDISESDSMWSKLGNTVVNTGKDFAFFGPLVAPLKSALDSTATSADDAATKTQTLGGVVNVLGDAIDGMGPALAGHVATMKELSDAVKTADEEYQSLLDSFTAVDDAMITSRSTVFDYQGAIDDLRTSLAKGGSFAPTTEQGRANWDALVNAAETANDRIHDALVHGGAAAATTVYHNARQTMHRMLTQATGDSKQAWRLVDQVLKDPHEMHVELDKVDVARLKAQFANLTRTKAKISANLQLPDPEGAVNQAMINAQNQLKPIEAKINAVTQHLDTAKSNLDDTANPGGQPRDAELRAKVDPTSVTTARNIFHSLTLPETKTITVHVVQSGTVAGGGFSGGGGGIGGFQGNVVQQILPPAVPPQPTQLVPKQTPVQVLLDGAVIADALEMKARRLASVGSVRRLP